MATGQRFITTTPKAQITAEEIISIAPSGARCKDANSVENSNSMPPMPSNRPVIRRRVSFSRSSQAENSTPQTGMV